MDGETKSKMKRICLKPLRDFIRPPNQFERPCNGLWNAPKRPLNGPSDARMLPVPMPGRAVYCLDGFSLGPTLSTAHPQLCQGTCCQTLGPSEFVLLSFAWIFSPSFLRETLKQLQGQGLAQFVELRVWPRSCTIPTATTPLHLT